MKYRLGQTVCYYDDKTSRPLLGVIVNVQPSVVADDPFLTLEGEFQKAYRYGREVYHPWCAYSPERKEIRRSLYRPKPPPFYEVHIKDKQVFFGGDPLCGGEKTTTHQVLVGQTKVASGRSFWKRREASRIRAKQSAIKVPWKYDRIPFTELERKLRRKYEHMWQANFPGSIPPILIKTGSWTKFWQVYTAQPEYQMALDREAEKRYPV